MPYFSRLTDIVTCNLSSILAQASDPRVALDEIIHEMSEGVAGAQRSVTTAGNNVARIEAEIGEQRMECNVWLKKAEKSLANGQESEARQALQRKHEVEDLIAGLEQQLEAAISTRDHLQTMRSALDARLADARRRLAGMTPPVDAATAAQVTAEVESAPVLERQSRVDQELEALRQRMKSTS